MPERDPILRLKALTVLIAALVSLSAAAIAQNTAAAPEHVTCFLGKSFATADGEVRVLFAEDLKPISKAMYDVLHSRLRPDKK